MTEEPAFKTGVKGSGLEPPNQAIIQSRLKEI